MCERISLPGGGFAIICGGHGRSRRTVRACVNCGRRPVEVLCDHRNSDGHTCSAPICRACALSVPGTARHSRPRDYCKRHAQFHASEVPNPLPLESPDAR